MSNYTVEALDAAVKSICRYSVAVKRVAYGWPDTGKNVGTIMFSTLRTLPGRTLDAATALGRSEITISVAPGGKFRVLSGRHARGVIVLYSGYDKEKAVLAFNTNEVVSN